MSEQDAFRELGYALGQLAAYVLLIVLVLGSIVWLWRRRR